MKEFEHQLFIKTNGLDQLAFSTPLQQKIEIFEKLHSKLDDTIDKDKEELTAELQELDQEIYQDILEEHEEVLLNNEFDDEELETGPAKQIVTSDSKQTQVPTNEAILDELYKMKRTENLKRSLLKELGITSNLSAWSTSLGKYELQRTAVFRFIYRLKKTK